MPSNEYAISLKTNRLVKKSTANYRKLKKLNLVKEVVDCKVLQSKEPQVEVEQPVLEPEKMKKVIKKAPEPTVVEDEPEFDESKLQLKLADISTDMIQKNLKKIVKSQKLSDIEMDDMLKRLLYKRLCLEPEPKPKKKEKPAKKKTKFKVVVPSSSESDSD
jgi:hypothetical protein